MDAAARAPQPADPADLLAALDRNLKSGRWEDSASLARHLPATLEGRWLEVADGVSFALGHLHRTDEAVALREAAYRVEPTYRRASALAYLHYDAMMQAATGRHHRRDRRGAPRRDREADRRAFLRWLKQALEHRPGSVKDLYRLGMFEARLESQHDAAALRAFRHAIASYRAMSVVERARLHHLRPAYVRSLYAAARSAMNLGRLADARSAIFACIREDAESHHVAPLFKLYLAGRVCLATRELDAAERALRLALDADGPRQRDFVLTTLAEVALARGDTAAARAWIESHLPPHRRSPFAWRLLGDIARAAGAPRDARVAFEHALRRDRAGRHLTLVRLGELHLADGREDEAERAFADAREFRRRTYQSDDAPALRGLAAVKAARGDDRGARLLHDQAAALARPGRAWEGAPDAPHVAHAPEVP